MEFYNRTAEIKELKRIVAIKTNNEEALVAEVKRNKNNYSHKKFMEKVERIKIDVLSNYKIESRLLTMEDM